ncbi:kinase-like protein [Auricularia subglabra TFB-10046 SS5]|nr:kinase-like protein [Auricularia subglabra TFB-10046 SS5]
MVPTGTQVAVKKMHITKHTPNSVLRHEACAYLLLAGHSSIPGVYAWGRSQYYDYLALELLGGDMFTVREGLTLRNLAAIACAILDALEHVHKHGLVHCDVKPSNFLFGASDRTLKLIDFGLVTPFRDQRTGAHLPERTLNHLRGTERYASIHAHMHIAPARRDDLISLSYTLAELELGRLPWHSARGVDFVLYASSLSFAEEPDYARWREAFRILVPGTDLPPNAVFDPADDSPCVSGDSDEGTGDDVAGPWPQIDAPPSVDSDEIPDSDDDWVPTMTWPPPTSVPSSDLIGDEQATVRAHLQHIEEPPAMDKPWLLCCDSPEAMLPL